MTNRQAMVKELDDLTRKIVFITQGGTCYIPGCRRAASDNAHIIGRGVMRTRWDTEPNGNCHLLCRECHNADHAGELHPTYIEVFVDNNGEEAYESLCRRARQVGGYTDTAIGFLLEKWRNKYAEVSEGKAEKK